MLRLSRAETAQLVLALDVGGTKVMCGVVNADGEVLCARKTSTCHDGGPTVYLAWLADFARDVVDGADLSMTDISAIGVAAPGLVEDESGVMAFDPFTGWQNVPFGDRLSDMLKLPCSVENDVNACALAEMRYGTARGIADFVWVTVSTGIGGAVVTRGELYRGSRGLAGEFGHIVVDEGGPVCGCGARGCLQACASGTGIAARARALFEEMKPDAAAPTTAEELAILGYGGDEFALMVWRETGTYIGRAMSFVVNVLNPEMIVLGGGVSKAAPLFFPTLESSLRERVIGAANKSVIVTTTTLGDKAGLLGAAAVASSPHQGTA